MATQERIVKVNRLVQETVGKLLFKIYDPPEGVFPTVTRVEASGNLQQAKVYISVIPEEKSAEIVEALGREIRILQRELNRTLKMRPIPKLILLEDKQEPKAQKMRELLDRIKEEGD